jgi:hypothetical protein
VNERDALTQYAGYPPDWLRSHGAYRARLAVVHAGEGRQDMAEEYLAESAHWFELAANQDTDGHADGAG